MFKVSCVGLRRDSQEAWINKDAQVQTVANTISFGIPVSLHWQSSTVYPSTARPRGNATLSQTRSTSRPDDRRTEDALC